MAFLTLKEAADYARFACAAYAVFEYEDPDEKDGKGNAIAGHCSATCGMCKPKGDMKTYATVIRLAFCRHISKQRGTKACTLAEWHCAATCGVCKPKGNMETYATVIRSALFHHMKVVCMYTYVHKPDAESR